MTQQFKPVPSPHPRESELGPAIAAPMVGNIILRWTEVEREMARFIRTERMRLEWRHPPNRELSYKFGQNLTEWLSQFVRTDQRKNEIRTEAYRLQSIRNDMAHNIWNIRLDTELGVMINVVRENEKFYREEMEWLAKHLPKGKRNQKPAPVSFYTNTYGTVELERAAVDMGELYSLMRREEADHYARTIPRPRV